MPALYPGTSVAGVFKSTDSGGSWAAVNSGLSDYALQLVAGLAIDPTTPSTLYVGNDDGVFSIEQVTVCGGDCNPQAVRAAARLVARELDLPEDWLNDAAKAFVPENAGYDTWQALSALTISTVDARTLLAMKCAAARTAEDSADIRFLANYLGLRSSAEIVDVLLRYYPAERLSIRVQLLLEEMFDDGV